MKYWLVKSEPSAWSWQDHVAKGVEPWDGVRNHQAARNLRSMTPGDLAFFYHSVKDKEVVGILEVVSEARPDPSDASGKFVAVEMRALKSLPSPVSLASIKANPVLSDIPLIRQSRLSVMELSGREWEEILKMAE